MILVVADTGPLHYLVLIDAIGVLPHLYDRAVIPMAVHRELTHPHSPAAVAQWAATLPSWCEVQSATQLDEGSTLGPGETEAIALAQELMADVVLMDDKAARREARGRGMLVTGTIGVLADAADHDLIDLAEAFNRLVGTTFYADPELIQQLLTRDAERRKQE